MCRLLGVVSATPISVSRAVGEDVLKDFVALTQDPRRRMGRRAVCDCPATTRRSRCRRAAPATTRSSPPPPMTSGRPRAWSIYAGRPPASRCSRRTHTRLSRERIAMAHNGSIKPIGLLDELLDTRDRRDHRGGTDSERYFGLIRQHRASSPDLAEAVRRAVSALRERLSRRQPERADPGRGPADRRARACAQSAAG